MTLPVPDRAPIVIYDRQGADDFAALGQALAAHRAQGPVNLLYAPTTITHHHPAPAPAALPAAYAGRPGLPGIDMDATGYGGGYVPPAYVPELAPVPERRSYAPLGFLVCGWSTLAAALGCAVTGGNPATIGAILAALTGSAASFAAIHRGQS
jgi:hypothetical protein